MGHTEQTVGIVDIMGHCNFSEQISLDRNPNTGVSQKTVRYDDRGTDRGESEAVCHCRPEMGNRFGATANIQGVGIGEKRFAAELLDVRGNATQKNRAHKGRISRFPEMEFDSHKIIWLDEVLYRAPLHQAVKLIEQASLCIHPQVRKVDRAFHGAFLASVFQPTG